MSSSGKGQAGLELARELWGGFRVHGVTATREYDVPVRTAAIANETAVTLGLDVRVRPEDVVNFGDFVGPGYGRPSQEGNEAVRLFARTEGLVLDPVYTGKCAAALIAHAREGRLSRDDTVGLRPHRRRAGDLHLEPPVDRREAAAAEDGPDHAAERRLSMNRRTALATPATAAASPLTLGFPAPRPRPGDRRDGP